MHVRLQDTKEYIEGLKVSLVSNLVCRCHDSCKEMFEVIEV
jgi:hypothetical protein